MFNFREISHTLLNAKAAIEVKNIVELKKSIAFLIAEPRKAVQMGNFAKDAIEQNKGASEKNIEMIRRFLS
jgi:3-deoxy-D-manno-octulosonic-acid transferase